MPPSTERTWPVMYWLSSDSRKVMARAMSSTVPRRPSGVWATRLASRSALRLRIVPSVGVAEGAMALTRIRRAPRSTAAARVMPITPALMPL
jgi:hypothetical protein